MFKVVDFEMANDAFIGRPAMAKFMCVAHYAYQLMKISGSNGIITVRRNPESGVRCDKKSLDLA